MFPLVLLFFFLSGPDWTSSYETGDCGIRYNNKNIERVKRSTDNGGSLRYNEVPWNVALYKMDNSSKYQFLCAGSIIDTNVILTGAHCIYDEKNQDLDNSRMFIAAGKYNNSWEHRDAHEQRFEVISKEIRVTYKGFEGRYQDDIALLVLNDTIKFSSAVMPVCVDWADRYKTLDNEIGTVFGWGYDENNVKSDKLFEQEMELLNFSDCRKSVGSGYSSFVTGDKICAVKKDNTPNTQIYSAGGLVFRRNQSDEETSARYFIKGILVGKSREEKSYFLFTKLSNHMPWINSTLKNVVATDLIRKAIK